MHDAPPPKNFCSYDACTSDADCGVGQVCECRNDANYDANVCFYGNCQFDADCGGEYGSPSLTDLASGCINVPPWSVGYFCHTRQDTCPDDSDCVSNGGSCAFSAQSFHWRCYAPMCLGGVGSRFESDAAKGHPRRVATSRAFACQVATSILGRSGPQPCAMTMVELRHNGC